MLSLASTASLQKRKQSPDWDFEPDYQRLQLASGVGSYLVLEGDSNQETSRTSGNPTFHLSAKPTFGTILHFITAPLRTSRTGTGRTGAGGPPGMSVSLLSYRLRNLSSVSCFPQLGSF